MHCVGTHIGLHRSYEVRKGYLMAMLASISVLVVYSVLSIAQQHQERSNSALESNWKSSNLPKILHERNITDKRINTAS